MRSRTRCLPVLTVVALLASATSVRAERHPEHMITLGYQTEHADIVAVARPGPAVVDPDLGTTTATFEIETAIRGDAAPGARLTVVHRDLGHGQPWNDGAPHLVFLRATQGSLRATHDGSAVYESLSGSFGFRPIATGTPSERFPAIVTAIAATLGDGATVAEPAELRRVLTGLIVDDDDGIASSAALDLERHDELHAGLSDTDRMAVLASFRARRPGRARRQLALAVAAVRPAGAAIALVDAVLEPDSDRDRTGIAEALRRLADPASEAHALTRLEAADPVQKQQLLVVLGAIGATRSVGPLRAAVGAPEAEVRVEAAHALGLVARNVRRADLGARVAGRAELLALQKSAATRGEQRAAIWALAQLDDPAAYDALRVLAADAEQPEDVRKYATRILESPRISLILD